MIWPLHIRVSHVSTKVGVLCLVISLSRQTPRALVCVWGCLSPQRWRVDSLVVVGAVAQLSEHLWLKQEALGSIAGSYPGFFLFQLAN